MTANLVPLPTAGQRYSRDQIELIKRTLMPRGSSDDELSLFIGIAQRLDLDPFVQQIRAIRRTEYNTETKRYDEKISIEPGIDGLRKVGHDTGEVEAQLGPYWCGPDGGWRDAWLEDFPPAAAKFGVLRKGYREPRWAVAHWREYRQTKRDGSTTRMWTDRPAGQLAKCAEALAWRAAFPKQLGGVYTTDEMAQADHDDAAATISRFAVVVGGIPTEDTIRGLESAAAAKELVSREIVSDRYRQAVKAAQLEEFGEVWEDFWRHANLASWVTVLLDACRAVAPHAIETSDPGKASAPPRPAGSDTTSEGRGPRGAALAPGQPAGTTAAPPPDTDASVTGQDPPGSPNAEAPTPRPSPTSPGKGRGQRSRPEVPGSASAGDLGEGPPAGATADDAAEQAAFDEAHADPGRWTR
jgi:phage recombination protein Bet